MKSNLLVFIAATDSIVGILKRKKTISVKKDGDFYILTCRFVSTDSNYLCVRVPYPTEDESRGDAVLMIPHAEVQFAIHADGEKALGSGQI